MTIEELAKTYKLKTKVIGVGDDVETIIPGSLGHLFMYDDNDSLLGALFMPPRQMKGWANRKKEFTELGAVVTQNGDTEGAVMFPSSSAKLVRTAMRLLGIKASRNISPEKKQHLNDLLSKARKKKKTIKQ